MSSSLTKDEFKPVITVITVSFNSVETIERTIESVVSQSYENIEYIIVDGDSTDGTVDIIRRYEKNIAKWVSEPDSGIYQAMNKGIAMASGDLIGFLSSNDWYDENALKAVAERFRETQADVVYGDVTVIDEGKVSRKDYSKTDLDAFRYTMPIIHPGLFVKREIQVKYKFDESYKSAADAKFFMQVYKAGYDFVYTNANIVFYGLGGMSSNYLIGPSENLRACKEVYSENFETYKREACGYYNIWLFDGLLKEAGFVDFARRRLVELEYDNIYLFGAGAKCKSTIEWLIKLRGHILGIFDSDVQKVGMVIDQWKVKSINDINELDKSVVIVSSTKFGDEMKAQAVRCIGNNEVKVICLFDFATGLVSEYMTSVGKKEFVAC